LKSAVMSSVGLSICRQTKRALESAVFTFREEIGPAFLLALKSLLSLDCQATVVHRHVNVLAANAREFESDVVSSRVMS
jgi:hypothetical protein